RLPGSSGARAARQGARAATFPDPEAAPRLAQSLQSPGRQRRRRRARHRRRLVSPPSGDRVPDMAARRNLIVVSNRGPVTYTWSGGERVASRGGGGLVTALRSL